MNWNQCCSENKSDISTLNNDVTNINGEVSTLQGQTYELGINAAKRINQISAH